jgi:hypothetical protein
MAGAFSINVCICIIYKILIVTFTRVMVGAFSINACICIVYKILVVTFARGYGRCLFYKCMYLHCIQKFYPWLWQVNPFLHWNREKAEFGSVWPFRLKAGLAPQPVFLGVKRLGHAGSSRAAEWPLFGFILSDSEFPYVRCIRIWVPIYGQYDTRYMSSLWKFHVRFGTNLNSCR